MINYCRSLQKYNRQVPWQNSYIYQIYLLTRNSHVRSNPFKVVYNRHFVSNSPVMQLNLLIQPPSAEIFLFVCKRLSPKYPYLSIDKYSIIIVTKCKEIQVSFPHNYWIHQLFEKQQTNSRAVTLHLFYNFLLLACLVRSLGHTTALP